jgi:hypothetical protein
MRGRLAVAVAAWLAIGAAWAAPPQPFVPGSFEELVAARKNTPFLLVLWSITCAPCREEFTTLAAVRRDYPALPLVLICTDDIAEADTATRVLQPHGLDDVESWMFADNNAQRLRYEIDPAWYGEMPRAYLYDTLHRREGISGSLARGRIEEWLRAIRKEIGAAVGAVRAIAACAAPTSGAGIAACAAPARTG